jgi:hypothetical protein
LTEYLLCTYVEINTNPSYTLENIGNYSQQADITKIRDLMYILMEWCSPKVKMAMAMGGGDGVAWRAVAPIGGDPSGGSKPFSLLIPWTWCWCEGFSLPPWRLLRGRIFVTIGGFL